MSKEYVVLAAALLIAGCSSDGPTGPALPTDVTLGALTATPQRGLQTGTTHADACAAGEAVIGYHGFTALAASSFIGQIQAICGSVGVAGLPSGSVAVLITAGSTTPLRGTNTHTEWTRSCPANQVVVGFGGRNGDLIDQLVIRCAPLVIGPQGDSWTVAVGASADLAAAGGTGGLPFAQTDCAAGSIATASDIRVAPIVEGGDAIEAFGLSCRAIALQFP